MDRDVERGTLRCDIEEAEVVDNGVTARLVAEEEFSFHGEHVERETSVRLLDDGGVSITQSDNQGSIDSLTLSDPVVRRIIRERERDDE